VDVFNQSVNQSLILAHEEKFRKVPQNKTGAIKYTYKANIANSFADHLRLNSRSVGLRSLTQS